MREKKKKDWEGFVENAKKNEIWIAHQFTKKRLGGKVPGKNLAPREVDEMTMRHFFPPSEHPAPAVSPAEGGFGQEAEVEAWEIDRVLERCSNKLAPGPDQIPYTVWKRIHKENDEIISWLASDLLKWSAHPEILKQTWSILLPTPGKPEYE